MRKVDMFYDTWCKFTLEDSQMSALSQYIWDVILIRYTDSFNEKWIILFNDTNDHERSDEHNVIPET